MHRDLILIICSLLLLSAPVHAGLLLFTPGPGSVSTTSVKDTADGPDDRFIFATDNGRSEYNGTWSIFHIWHSDYTEGPLSEFCTAVESDADGNLWIGYPNGLQITRDGTQYTTIDDQQLLKNLAINDLQARGSEMWVATGNAGIHRFYDGAWTWYKPHAQNSPGCYRVEAMAVDYDDGALYAASRQEGIWKLDDSAGGFSECLDRGSRILGVEGIGSDVSTGIFYYNETHLFRYRQDSGSTPVLDIADLPPGTNEINAVSQTTAGMYVIATDGGVIGWQDGAIVLHLDRTDGLVSNLVKYVAVDNADRIWFANTEYVGCYFEDRPASPIPVMAPTSEPLAEDGPAEDAAVAEAGTDATEPSVPEMLVVLAGKFFADLQSLILST
ncbi:MAG: hypothetical protein GKC04_03470 [Methanomicrobiales archaeon]|nr:hypothetical protein [Methanomicrobiales archaeon]